MILAGLDIETTGLDHWEDCRLIQIGIYIPKQFSQNVQALRLVYDVKPTGDMFIEQRALEINRFTLSRIENGLVQEEVDSLVEKHLMTAGFKAEELTPVGWNVGSFDLPFIRKELPKTAKFFSRRTFDLTGLGHMYEYKTGISYRVLKEEFHAKIVKALGEDKRHDALYDAEAAIAAIALFAGLK